MKNLEIKNKGDQMILKLNRKGFDENYLMSLIKRLRVEEMAQKADFDPGILSIAEEINQEWWDKKGEDFLKDINQ